MPGHRGLRPFSSAALKMVLTMMLFRPLKACKQHEQSRNRHQMHGLVDSTCMQNGNEPRSTTHLLQKGNGRCGPVLQDGFPLLQGKLCKWPHQGAFRNEHFWTPHCHRASPCLQQGKEPACTRASAAKMQVLSKVHEREKRQHTPHPKWLCMWQELDQKLGELTRPIPAETLASGVSCHEAPGAAFAHHYQTKNHSNT